MVYDFGHFRVVAPAKIIRRKSAENVETRATSKRNTPCYASKKSVWTIRTLQGLAGVRHVEENTEDELDTNQSLQTVPDLL